MLVIISMSAKFCKHCCTPAYLIYILMIILPHNILEFPPLLLLFITAFTLTFGTGQNSFITSMDIDGLHVHLHVRSCILRKLIWTCSSVTPHRNLAYRVQFQITAVNSNGMKTNITCCKQANLMLLIQNSYVSTAINEKEL